MASDDLTSFLKVWLQSGQDAERLQKKFLLAGIDAIVPQSSDVFSRIKRGPIAQNPAVYWTERPSYDVRLSGQLTDAHLVFSGQLLGADLTANTLSQHIRPGTILERSDHLQVKVTAVDAQNLTATVEAHGNTGELSNDAAAVTWDLLGDALSDYNVTHFPKGLEIKQRRVGTQIHEETFEYPHTWRNTAFENISNNVQDQLTEIVRNLRLKIARSVLRVAPTYTDGGYVTGSSIENPTMTGLCQWPRLMYAEHGNANVFVNKNGAELELTDLDNLIFYMENDMHADLNSGSWSLVCHPVQHMYLSDMLLTYRRMTMAEDKIGYSVNVYESKRGKVFPIIIDWNMPESMFLVANLAACSWGYYKGDDIWTKDLPTQGRFEQKLITCQTYGVVVRRPGQSLGCIYGLPKTYSA